MYKCEKCGSTNIVCNSLKMKTQAGNDLYINRNFGEIVANIQLCWCSECGTKHNIDILNIEKNN